MKIGTYNVYKHMKNTTSFWWLMKPSIQRLWMGKMIYIGLNAFGIILDFRGIKTMKDFADALGRPKIWHILKKLKR